MEGLDAGCEAWHDWCRSRTLRGVVFGVGRRRSLL